MSPQRRHEGVDPIWATPSSPPLPSSRTGELPSVYRHRWCTERTCRAEIGRNSEETGNQLQINCDFSHLFTPLASCKLTFLFLNMPVGRIFTCTSSGPNRMVCQRKRDVAASYGVCIWVRYSSVAVKRSDETGGFHTKKKAAPQSLQDWVFLEERNI